MQYCVWCGAEQPLLQCVLVCISCSFAVLQVLQQQFHCMTAVTGMRTAWVGRRLAAVDAIFVDFVTARCTSSTWMA
jgi:hypothetical protein